MVFNTLVWERYDTSVIDCYKLIFPKRNIYKELKNDIGIFVGQEFFKLWAKTVKILFWSTTAIILNCFSKTVSQELLYLL